jgi:hypothetical protein
VNDKDKEAYEKWLEAQKYDYDSWDDKHCRNGLVVSIYSETEEAWQAACEYKDAEIKKLREALEVVLGYDGDFLSTSAEVRLNVAKYAAEQALKGIGT